MARQISLHTVVLASMGSGSAALLAQQSGLTGTVIGAALVPVVVAAVTELGSRPLERLARARRRAAAGEGAPRAAAPAARGGWERWAAGSAVALAVGALAVAMAGEPAPARTQVVIREVQTTRYAEVQVPGPPQTVTVVQRVEVPVPTPADADDPAKDPPAGEPAAPGDGVTTPGAEIPPGETVPQEPVAPEGAAGDAGSADPAAVDGQAPADPPVTTVKEQAPQAV